MEHSKDSVTITDMFTHPAFRVRDGVITEANQAAIRRQIPVGSPVSTVLDGCQEEYDAFTDGFLTLSISPGGFGFLATVVRTQEGDIFHIQSQSDNSALRAMALAAQKLSEPVNNLMTAANQLFPSEQYQTSEQKALAAQINRSLYQLQRDICNMSAMPELIRERPYSIQNLDIAGLIDELVTNAQPMAAQAGRQLVFTGIPEHIPCLTDEELLERALYNLISNAIKFSPKGSTITAKLSQFGTKLRFTIENSCESFDRELMANMFLRYTRASDIEDGRYGIGLGIPIAQAAAAAHKGTLLADQPEPGKLRFTLTLSVRQKMQAVFRSPLPSWDYTGGNSHALVELSGVLPVSAYEDVN